jgi:hypothetical protein
VCEMCLVTLSSLGSSFGEEPNSCHSPTIPKEDVRCASSSGRTVGASVYARRAVIQGFIHILFTTNYAPSSRNVLILPACTVYPFSVTSVNF